MRSVADRILIYGVSGAGKTTLAARLSGRTGIPWQSVDDLTWEPGWTEVPQDTQRQRIAGICAGERWILDSAHNKWMDVPLARVQLIVALDYPRWVSLGRLVWRTFRRMIDRSEICNGNTESLRQAFTRDSIVAWHFRSFARKRARIRAWVVSPPSAAEVVRLTSPRAARRWLDTFNNSLLNLGGERPGLAGSTWAGLRGAAPAAGQTGTAAPQTSRAAGDARNR